MVRRPGPGPVSSQRTGYGVRERGQMMLHLGSSPGGAVGTHSTLPGLHGVSELGERPGQAEGSGTPGARAWGSVSAPSLDKPAGARAGGCVLSVSGLTKQPVCPASQDSALGMPRAQPRLPVVSEATLWAHFHVVPRVVPQEPPAAAAVTKPLSRMRKVKPRAGEARGCHKSGSSPGWEGEALGLNSGS